MTTPAQRSAPDPSDDFRPILYTFDALQPWEQMFVTEYLVDGCPGKAATRAGMDGGHSANHLMRNPAVRAVIAQRMADRAYRLGIKADDVLSGLWEQYQRLLAMLSADWQDIKNDDGSLKPISEWPELWRTAMVNGIEVEAMFERSDDGVQGEERKSWDTAGKVTKIRSESRLGIEKQIEITLRSIGMLTSVDAFVKNKPGDVNVMVVTAETARRVTSARARLAKVVKPESPESEKSE